MGIKKNQENRHSNAGKTMMKHPDCEDHCQLLEHKGYHTCSQTGRCEQLDHGDILAELAYAD